MREGEFRYALNVLVSFPHTEARLIQARLRVHPKLQHVEQDLDVALGLHETTHDAITGQQVTWGKLYKQLLNALRIVDLCL